VADDPKVPGTDSQLGVAVSGSDEPPVPYNMAKDPARQCTATNRQGRRCRRSAILGGTVCIMHGGSAPQVRRRANLRLIELVDPAIAVLARIMSDPSQPAHARIRAAENVLDRAGLPRRVDVVSDETAKAALLERLIALREQQSARGTAPGQAAAEVGHLAGQLGAASQIVAGEVVTNDPQPGDSAVENGAER
jgi:hypothetical protein